MNRRYLSDEEIQGLNRDLRILVTTNGTLTRILNIVTADEIVIENIDQEILPDAPTPPDPHSCPKAELCCAM